MLYYKLNCDTVIHTIQVPTATEDSNDSSTGLCVETDALKPIKAAHLCAFISGEISLRWCVCSGKYLRDKKVSLSKSTKFPVGCYIEAHSLSRFVISNIWRWFLCNICLYCQSLHFKSRFRFVQQRSLALFCPLLLLDII
jgi:hypothetical protein